MLQIVLLGTGAGATAALLFASIASGSMIAIILSFLAPLPILLAALGWSHWAALIAALVGSASIAATFGIVTGLAFMAGIGFPGWWLGYLTMLARPGTQPNVVEWYPPGNLVFWASLSGLLFAGTTLFQITNHHDRLSTVLRPAFEQMLGGKAGLPATDIDRVVVTFLLLAPSIAAVTIGAINLINLWLAGRIVQASGRLKRPWPDISALTLPRRTPLLLGAAALGWFLPGALGWAAGALAAVLLLAFAVVGFAVLHATTHALNGRAFIIGSAYGAVLILSGWPMLIFAMLGLADVTFDLRGRAAMSGRAPPNLPKP